MKCSNVPERKKGKRKKKRKEGEKKGKKGREEGERKRERKVNGQNRVAYWERRRKCVKRNEGAATRKKNIFRALQSIAVLSLLIGSEIKNLKTIKLPPPRAKDSDSESLSFWVFSCKTQTTQTT